MYAESQILAFVIKTFVKNLCSEKHLKCLQNVYSVPTIAFYKENKSLLGLLKIIMSWLTLWYMKNFLYILVCTLELMMSKM